MKTIQNNEADLSQRIAKILNDPLPHQNPIIQTSSASNQISEKRIDTPIVFNAKSRKIQTNESQIESQKHLETIENKMKLISNHVWMQKVLSSQKNDSDKILVKQLLKLQEATNQIEYISNNIQPEVLLKLLTETEEELVDDVEMQNSEIELHNRELESTVDSIYEDLTEKVKIFRSGVSGALDEFDKWNAEFKSMNEMLANQNIEIEVLEKKSEEQNNELNEIKENMKRVEIEMNEKNRRITSMRKEVEEKEKEVLDLNNENMNEGGNSRGAADRLKKLLNRRKLLDMISPLSVTSLTKHHISLQYTGWSHPVDIHVGSIHRLGDRTVTVMPPKEGLQRALESRLNDGVSESSVEIGKAIREILSSWEGVTAASNEGVVNRKRNEWGVAV